MADDLWLGVGPGPATPGQAVTTVGKVVVLGVLFVVEELVGDWLSVESCWVVGGLVEQADARLPNPTTATVNTAIQQLVTLVVGKISDVMQSGFWH